MLISGQPIVIAYLLSAALALLIAMTIHEFAHNYIGYRMGDPTPRDMGKLTLNPLKHIYWPGWLMWLIVGFGILGSAPISEARMRDRRWGFLLAVAAGPFSNLLIAVFVGILYRLNLWQYGFFGPRDIIPNFNQFMTVLLEFNLLLFVFNLLPVFPFDGWFVLIKLLPPRESYMVQRYQNEIMLVFLGLFLLSFVGVPVLSYIILPPISFLRRLVLGI